MNFLIILLWLWLSLSLLAIAVRCEGCAPPSSPLTRLIVSDYSSIGRGVGLANPLDGGDGSSPVAKVVDLAYTIVAQCFYTNPPTIMESLLGMVSRIPYEGVGFEKPIIEFPPPALPGIGLSLNQSALLRRVYRVHPTEQRWYFYGEYDIRIGSFLIDDYFKYGTLAQLPKLPTPKSASSPGLRSLLPSDIPTTTVPLPPSHTHQTPRPLLSHFYLGNSLDPTVTGSGLVHVSYSVVFRCIRGEIMETARSATYTTSFNTVINYLPHSRPAFMFPEVTYVANNDCSPLALKVYRLHPIKQTWHFYNAYPSDTPYFFLDSWLNYGDSIPSARTSSCAFSVIPPPLGTDNWLVNGVDKSIMHLKNNKVYITYSYIIRCDDQSESESGRSSIAVKDYNYDDGFYQQSQPVFQFPAPPTVKNVLGYNVYRFHLATSRWVLLDTFDIGTVDFSVTSWNFTTPNWLSTVPVSGPPLSFLRCVLQSPSVTQTKTKAKTNIDESMIRSAITKVVSAAVHISSSTILVTDIHVDFSDAIEKSYIITFGVDDNTIRDTIISQSANASSSLRLGLPLLVSVVAVDMNDGDDGHPGSNNGIDEMDPSSSSSSGRKWAMIQITLSCVGAAIVAVIVLVVVVIYYRKVKRNNGKILKKTEQQFTDIELVQPQQITNVEK